MVGVLGKKMYMIMTGKWSEPEKISKPGNSIFLDIAVKYVKYVN